ncbi:MAG: polysaccharide pyruvyl transferase family protein [Candidatus Zixiibacteriota bacterium]
MAKIIIEGFYGYANLGDEAILMAFIENFSKMGADVSIMTGSPEKVEKDYDLRAIQKNGRRYLPKRFLKILSSDLYILGGGGLLKDFGDDSKSLKSWLHNIDIANKLGKKTALGAIGVENVRFEESFHEIKRVISNVDLITVRDQISYDILREAGIKKDIHIFSDPAVILAEAKKRSIDKGKINVFVSLRHWFSTGFKTEDSEIEARFHRQLARFFDEIATNVKLHFIPMRTVDYDNDVEIAKKLVSHMQQDCEIEINEVPPSVEGFIDMLDDCDIMIGMRLHSAILATAKAIPTIAISYSPKVKGYMEKIGMVDFCKPPKIIEADTLFSAYQELIDKYDHYNSLLKKNSETQKNLAKNNIQILYDFAND